MTAVSPDVRRNPRKGDSAMRTDNWISVAPLKAGPRYGTAAPRVRLRFPRGFAAGDETRRMCVARAIRFLEKEAVRDLARSRGQNRARQSAAIKRMTCPARLYQFIGDDRAPLSS